MRPLEKELEKISRRLDQHAEALSVLVSQSQALTEAMAEMRESAASLLEGQTALLEAASATLGTTDEEEPEAPPLEGLDAPQRTRALQSLGGLDG